MTGTFASRAFFTRAAIFGSDATHDGRGSQTVLVMSSTRSAAPFTGTSTATAAGMVGIAEVGAGVGDAVVIGKIDVDAVDGDGAAAGWVQPARAPRAPGGWNRPTRSYDQTRSARSRRTRRFGPSPPTSSSRSSGCAPRRDLRSPSRDVAPRGTGARVRSA